MNICKRIKESRSAGIVVECSLLLTLFLFYGFEAQRVGMSSPPSVRVRCELGGMSGTFARLCSLLLLSY